MAQQVIQLMSILVGAGLLGAEFGVNVGVGIGAIAYSLMPAEQTT